MLINLSQYAEAKKVREKAMVEAFRAAQKAETTQRARLEWVLADLIADIEAA